MEVMGDPSHHREISCVQLLNGHKRRFEEPEKIVIINLLEFIKVHVQMLSYFPMPVPLIVKRAKRYGLEPTISRTSWFNGCSSGKFPAPIKLGERTTVWRVEDIRRLIENGTPTDSA